MKPYPALLAALLAAGALSAAPVPAPAPPSGPPGGKAVKAEAIIFAQQLGHWAVGRVAGGRGPR